MRIAAQEVEVKFDKNFGNGGDRQKVRATVVPNGLATMLWFFVCLGCGALTVPTSAEVLCASRLPRLPSPLSNNAVTSVRKPDGTWSVLSFMGIGDGTEGSITAASYRLDLPHGSWTQIADAPRLNGKAKIGASAISVAGSVYLIGGYTVGVTEVTEKRLFRYDLNHDRFDELASVPREVDDTVAAVYEDRYIFLMSGWHGPINRNIPDVQIYDTQTNEWQAGTPMLGPGRFGHSGSILGNRIVSFDGALGSGSFSINNQVFEGTIDPRNEGDITNIDWQRLPPHPGAPTYRAAASQGVAFDDRLLVLGGTSNTYNFSGVGYNNQPSTPLDQALTFDATTGGWAELPIVGQPLATMDHRGLVAVPGGWATVGGMVGPGDVTDEVVHYALRDSPALCAVPEPTVMESLAGFALLVCFLFAAGVRSRSQVGVLSSRRTR